MRDYEPTSAQMRADAMKAISFGRYGQALLRSKGDLMGAIAFAEKQFRDTPLVIDALKAAVAAGNTTDSTYAAPLVLPNYLSSEFAAILAPLTLLGRCPFRPMPANVKYSRLDTGCGAAFVGEGSAVPLSKLSLTTKTLTFAKCVGILTMTLELANFRTRLRPRLSRPTLPALSLRCWTKLLSIRTAPAPALRRKALTTARPLSSQAARQAQTRLPT